MTARPAESRCPSTMRARQREAAWAYGYLVTVLMPKPMEPLASMAMMACRLISSSYCLMT